MCFYFNSFLCSISLLLLSDSLSCILNSVLIVHAGNVCMYVAEHIHVAAKHLVGVRHGAHVRNNSSISKQETQLGV